MKFFNYEEIFIAAHGNPDWMLEYFKQTTTGKDFILNPKAVVGALWLPNRVKAEYIGMCSFRRYEDYAHTGNVDLDLSIVPIWFPMDIAEKNPLVKLTNDKIIFLKEK